MPHYSEETKRSLVAKHCTPGGPPIRQLAKDTGISANSLYNWVKAYGKEVNVSKKRRPEDWNPEERLKAVLEAQGLDEQEQGEFLRKKGLHSHHIEQWKKEALSDAANKKKAGRPRKDPELVSLEKENKELKRDLRRKDKALAEQTALVILQKKAQALWGQDEDDESL